MIAITGAAGFIGSALAWKLNVKGRRDLLLVDDLGESSKWINLSRIALLDYLEKNKFLEYLKAHPNNEQKIEVIYHLGACSSTTETNTAFLMENNFEYSKTLALWCLQNGVSFIYASSAATYGDGSRGYGDSEEYLSQLRPLNPYGYSKHVFDQWAYGQGHLKTWVGLKYFNVYGPNEYHKADMRSVVLKAFEQIEASGSVKLFKSHRKDYEDGHQLRDFIYIRDAVDMTLYCHENKIPGGIYNIGTGKARSWLDLVNALFHAMGREPRIEFIPMPQQIREKYQYHTQADMVKFLGTGYDAAITDLEEGVTDYAKHLSAGFKRLGEVD